MIPSSESFPVFRFNGNHREIGRQFGEAAKELISRHLSYAEERLLNRGGIARERAAADSLHYRQFVIDHAPFFDDEILGLCEGANLDLWQGYMLQLRAELAVTSRDPSFQGDECTTFAVLPDATVNKRTMIGQNADLPSFYAEVGVIITLEFDDMPNVLMITPAGQLSYIGINDRGLGVCANFLTCDGWRHGFPRYLLSRLALTTDSVGAALARIRSVPRASSRNLLLCDATSAIDVENTVTEIGVLEPEGDILVHANHYVHPDLLGDERSPERYLVNSRTRHARLTALLQEEHGSLTPERMQDLYRDRETAPDAVCRVLEDEPDSDTITFASLIAEPASGRAWIAKGPPNNFQYQQHEIATAGIGAS